MIRTHGGLDLQEAIYALLEANLSYKICDYVSHEEKYPYIQVGEEKTEDESTKTGCGETYKIDILAFSITRGYYEVKRIASEIMTVLSKNKIVLEDYNVTLFKFLACRFYKETVNSTKADIIRDCALTYKIVLRQKGN